MHAHNTHAEPSAAAQRCTTACARNMKSVPSHVPAAGRASISSGMGHGMPSQKGDSINEAFMRRTTSLRRGAA